MSKTITPESFFDSLSLAYKLDGYLDGFKKEEIHLFSYFSSLLYIYKGNPIANWPHRYVVTEGYPYSENIDESINRHILNGLFEEKKDYCTITGRGVDEYNKFKDLSTFKKREEILNAACTTSLLIPYSQTLRALLNEPELKKANELKNMAWLDQTNNYPQLREISNAVGVNADDLILPAVTWINFLNFQ